MWNSPEWASQEQWDAYAWFGFAISEAQMMERSLQAIATALAKSKMSDNHDDDSWFTLYDKNGRLTLGQLLKCVKEYDVVSPELITRLESAVKIRNKLAHNFFWDSSQKKGDYSIISAQKELMAAASVFNNLSDPLMNIAAKLIEKLHGY